MGVVLVKNNKGGVGKSWIALQLAAYKAFQNEKVLLLTSDSQNNVLNYSGIKIEDTNKKGLEDLLEGKNYELTKLRPNLFFLHLQDYKVKGNLDEKFKKQISILKKEFKHIIIDGSPVMNLDNVFVDVAEHIIVPTFLDSVTTNSILNLLKKTDISKIRAVIPNRVGRTKIEKDFYTFLKNKLTRSGVFLSIPINQSSIILKLIENGTLLWERRSQKLDEIKNVFVKVWREIEDE
ncbi:ParA family protein [Fusobacterium polymorphum]|jgi:ATPase, parA FAMILY|uniref:ATPase, ParA FAMILY n=2 Tax=Fusobacterium TaxID=848 RepID=Q7P395_FUSVC|nr:ParA family protein [Fusobacterium nucleatum]EAA25217.1 ATPase, ParA FAMILY [Fusobacterium vincentii ATCC 49256]KUL98087.1 ATPase [Fusobacterium nucleatum subsp. nucleatum]WDF25873.1 ParA family protein [Fusobacterium nucleatum]